MVTLKMFTVFYLCGSIERRQYEPPRRTLASSFICWVRGRIDPTAIHPHLINDWKSWRQLVRICLGMHKSSSEISAAMFQARENNASLEGTAEGTGPAGTGVH